MRGKTKVHFGCGSNRLDGWINVDLDRSCKLDMVADLRLNLPFRSQSVDYIHSEDFIEHLKLEEGIHFLEECHRILKMGGAMRLLTPDLHQIAKRYVTRDEEFIKQFEATIASLGLHPLKTRKGAEVFNAGMRWGGHTFLYDGEILTSILEKIGFESKKAHFNSSAVAELRGIDVRSPETGVSLYYDCYKGKPIEKGSALSWLCHTLRSMKWLWMRR